MSKHDPLICLRHMLDYTNDAITLARGKNFEDLENTTQMRYALIYLVGVIGEAAKRIPAEFQKEHSEIPWQQIISARNRMIHGYDNIKLGILWEIVNDDLPALKARLEKILQ